MKKKTLLEEILLLAESIETLYWKPSYFDDSEDSYEYRNAIPDISDLSSLFNYLYKFGSKGENKKLVSDFINKYRDLFTENWYTFSSLNMADSVFFDVIKYPISEIMNRYRYYSNINPKKYKFSNEEKFEQYIKDLSALINKLEKERKSNNKI